MADQRFESLLESFLQLQKQRSELEMQLSQLQHFSNAKDKRIKEIKDENERLEEQNNAIVKAIEESDLRKIKLESSIAKEVSSRSDMSHIISAMEMNELEREKSQTATNSLNNKILSEILQIQQKGSEILERIEESDGKLHSIYINILKNNL